MTILDDIPAGGKFKVDNVTETYYMRLDMFTTPNGEEFYSMDDILVVDVVTGGVFKINKYMEIFIDM